MNKLSKMFEIVIVVAIVVAIGTPVMAGWGDGQAVFGENGQKIDANTAGQIDIVDDTDAVTLLTFGLKSENTYSDMENGNQIVINLMEAKNAANEDTVLATMTTSATSITNGTEEATIVIKTMVGGTLTTLLTIDADGLTIVGDLTASNITTTTEAVAGHFGVTSNFTVGGTATITGALAAAAADVDSVTTDAGAGLDTQAAGTLLLGAVTADKVEIADAGVDTEVQGDFDVLGNVTITSNTTFTGFSIDTAQVATGGVALAITATSGLIELHASANATNTLAAPGAALVGAELTIVNALASTVIFADSTPLQLSGTLTLGQYDTLTLKAFSATEWVQISTSDN